jgi:hypothetical protein
MITLKRAFCGLLVGSLALVLACSQALTLSGPGSETTNGKVVTGIAELPDGTPASGAAVFVHNAASLPDTSRVDSAVAPDTVTGADGSFSCVVPETGGEYSVEINYQNKNAFLTRLGALSSTNLGHVALPQTAGFHGIVDLQNISSEDNIYVQVYGSRRQFRVDALGAFSFLGVPSGRHVIKVFSNKGAYGVINKDTVELFPAEIRDMQTYILPFNAWRDTVVVRAILDSNGLDTVKVADVTTINDNQRIVSLNLIGQGITTLPGSVSLLRLRRLWLGNNKLTALPDKIGRMTTLYEVGCKQNSLASLPATLGSLIHLTVLDVSRNKLSALPVELTNLTQLLILSVDYNNLLVVDDPILTWLNAYANNTAWASTQQ